MATTFVGSDSALELRKFVAPEFVFGLDARRLVGRYAQNVGARKVLLVTDRELYTGTPWVEEAVATLVAADVPCVVFDRVSPNPRSAEVMAGAACYARERCNAVVAVGGGSVMDCAKGIGIVCSNGGSVLDFEGVDRIARPMPPLICIPTTSGTASEVSQFSIILDETRRTKIAIVSKAAVPDVGLVDPATTTTMDPYLTACTGMDALTHAVEAFVSNASSPITDLHALEAIRLIHEALPAVIAEPGDMLWRGRMMLGSLEAGLAFSNAILGAVHAMVVHAQDGLCDLSITGPSRITEVRDGAIHTYTIDPETFGLRRASLDHLKVDSPAASAAAVRAVLAGDAGPRRDMVLLNAAAALVVANRANDLPAGIARAAEAIDSRAAATTLAKWIELSRSA
jgi:alcohol dehydrogenase class IV